MIPPRRSCPKLPPRPELFGHVTTLQTKRGDASRSFGDSLASECAGRRDRVMTLELRSAFLSLLYYYLQSIHVASGWTELRLSFIHETQDEYVH